MRKRLRKKLYVGEFKELGFRLSFRLVSGLTPEDRSKVLEDFYEQAIDPQGLQFGSSGSGDTWEGFAALDAPRGSATDAHREAVARWLEANPLVLNHEVGPLVDARHFGRNDP